MGAKQEKSSTKLSPAEIKKARDDAPAFLSQAVKHLLDDDNEGGIFYAHIIQQMCRDFDDKRIPTAAVSVTDKINLYINPVFWTKELANAQQRAAVLKHEILHLILHHCTRCMDFGDRELANIAADLVVNSQVNPAIFGDMSKRFIFPQNFKLPHDETLDFYYKNFPVQTAPICRCNGCQSCQPQPSGKSGAPQPPKADEKGGHDCSKHSAGECDHKHDEGKSGKGKGKKDSKGSSGDSTEAGDSGEQDGGNNCVGPGGKCGHCGGYKSFDFHGVWGEDMSQVSEAMRGSLVNDAINRAAEAAKDAGNLPNAVRQAIALAKKKPQIPWELVLRQFISKLSAGILYHTKKRISKRFHTRPGPKIKPQLKLLLSVDVSGSISDREYEIFLNEGLAILRNIGAGCVEVLEWDAAITSEKNGKPGPYKLQKDYKVTRTGCGGTSPTPAINWINENRNQYDGVIWFTDGHFYDGDIKDKLQLPSLWVISADGTTEHVKDRYRTIKLPKSDSDAA